MCPFDRYVGCVDLKISFNKIERFTLRLFRGFVLGVVYVVELEVVLPTKRFELLLLFFSRDQKGSFQQIAICQSEKEPVFSILNIQC